ncbi:MAG: hypothetical protein AB1Z18_00905, partial [Desulfobacterales bacterium]
FKHPARIAASPIASFPFINTLLIEYLQSFGLSNHSDPVGASASSLMSMATSGHIVQHMAQ